MFPHLASSRRFRTRTENVRTERRRFLRDYGEEGEVRVLVEFSALVPCYINSPNASTQRSNLLSDPRERASGSLMHFSFDAPVDHDRPADAAAGRKRKEGVSSQACVPPPPTPISRKPWQHGSTYNRSVMKRERSTIPSGFLMKKFEAAFPFDDSEKCL